MTTTTAKTTTTTKVGNKALGQVLASLMILIAVSGGYVYYTDVFSNLLELKGITSTMSGDTKCATKCETYLNVTTTYWKVCFGNYSGTKYDNEILFRKTKTSRVLYVNTALMTFANGSVSVDTFVPDTGKNRWKSLPTEYCWERGKVNRMKFVGYKNIDENAKVTVTSLKDTGTVNWTGVKYRYDTVNGVMYPVISDCEFK
jgi:hypothetical protein